MFSVEWQFVTIMYTYCIPSNSLNPPSPSQAIQNHAQSWNKCGYVIANVVIILINIDVTTDCCWWCLVMATSSWCLWSLSRHRTICGLWSPAAAGVMSPGQDIGVGAAKFNFRKYPVLFPTFISSLRLKFTTRLPYSLGTKPTLPTQKSSFYGKINYTGSCFY